MLKILRPDPKEPPVSIYGPDPGDASVQHHYMSLIGSIREDIAHAGSCPQFGPWQKARDLAEALAPGRKRKTRAIRTILTFLIMLQGTTQEKA